MSSKKNSGTGEENLPTAQNTSISPVENAEAIALMKQAREVATSDLNELTGSKFFDFDKEREKQKTNEFNFYFKGFEMYEEKDGKTKDVLSLVTPEGDNVLNADAVFLSSMRKYAEKNSNKQTVCRVVYTGEKVRNEKGEYRKLQVFTF